MNEKDYIKLSNRVRVTSALGILKNVLAGEEYGVPEDKINQAIKILYEIEASLWSYTQRLLIGRREA